MKYLLIFVIFLSGCQTHETFITPELQYYYDQFNIEAELYDVNLPEKEVLLFLDDIKQNGLSKDGKNWAEIRISRSFFEKNKDKSHIIECLVFHELGHGILGRNHYNKEKDSTVYVYSIFKSDTLHIDEIVIGVPISIMHEGGGYNPVSSFYLQNRDYYLGELFK